MVRDFPYPLNVFMHVITREEGEARDLHYGLFENPGESILTAQQRSTDLVVSRLPSPPARVLDVGMGLGRTLAKLGRLRYDVEGIAPDEHQVALAVSRFGRDLRARVAAFESFTSPEPYDVLLFQESSQYIDSDRLFDRSHWSRLVERCSCSTSSACALSTGPVRSTVTTVFWLPENAPASHSKRNSIFRCRQLPPSTGSLHGCHDIVPGSLPSSLFGRSNSTRFSRAGVPTGTFTARETMGIVSCSSEHRILPE